MPSSSQSGASMVVSLDDVMDPKIEAQYRNEAISLSVMADVSCWASITVR